MPRRERSGRKKGRSGPKHSGRADRRPPTPPALSREWERRTREHSGLLKAIRRHLPALREWASNCIDSMWGYEDGVYRFYHHSSKVRYLQGSTERAVRLFRRIRPSGLNRDFESIVLRGASDDATPSDIVTAFLHTKYFVEMMIRYGMELEEPPSVLPSGWASVLYLYNLR